MIPSANDDPIRERDVDELLRQAAKLPPTPELRRLLIAAQQGDGDAMERLARRVEP